MIVGLGYDLLDVARVEKMLGHDFGLAETLFTTSEIRYCREKRYPARHFAARFAAKEALLKALGTGYRNGVSWLHIEVRNDRQGRPGIVLHGKVEELAQTKNVARIHVSLTHTADYAAASIVLES